jgi:uncharacterized membrane protein
MLADIPSIWREGLWHPLSVHLPIAALFLSSVAAIFVEIIANKGYKAFLKKFVFTLLAIGVASGWIAIYTGELAYTIEVRKICDPKILQEHQWWSYAVLIAYSTALTLKISRRFTASVFSKIIKPIYLLLMIVSLCGLVYTGHLGASLVYQQAAGVYVPSPDCTEFVK